MKDNSSAIFVGCMVLGMWISCAAKNIKDGLDSVASAQRDIASAISTK